MLNIRNFFCGSINKKNNKVISNTAWLFGERVFTILLTMSLSIVMARYLQARDFGIYNFLVSIVTILTPLTALGLNAVAVKEFVEHKDKEAVIFGTTCFMRFLGGGVAACILIFCDYFFNISGGNLIWITFLSLANIFTCFQVLDFWFQSQLNSKMAVISRFSVVLFSSLAKIIALVFFDATLKTILIIQTLEIIFSGLSFLCVYSLMGGKISLWKNDNVLAVSLIKKSWWLILSGVAEIIYLKIDQVMLGSMTGYESVATYAVAAKLSEAWYFLPNIVMASFFPLLILEKNKSEKDYMSYLEKITRRLLMLSIVIAIFVSFFSYPVIHILYGEEYTESAKILTIHIWAGVFVFMRAVLSKWLVIENLLRFSLVTHLSGAVFNVFLNLIFIPSYGAIGASISTVISYAVSSYFSLLFFKKTQPMGIIMTKALFSPFLFFIKRG
ncbi:flippase [Brenneria goodwinii]|uniref:flippase n=1 Tax=Brenneria goodwinii TaxID=1109412 RepID=UPI000F1B7B78|nr:flippase [Brenneria goodwinii]MCG8158727.1 flippase [Brenneria goodwinii]MCG8163258.1 flippase [Brenneria goodwinii]MCG8167679.1 flippase [Brenneria goodwinii]MCG8170585.1 flippase [Brenneria goodwinii]MCG8174415.1 flippase [Brenneria goodwinii]